MVLYELFKTLAFPIGIYALRNGPVYYRSLRVTYESRKASIRPVPPQTSRALQALFAFAAIALLSTFSYFVPENIFAQTNGRLQTSNEVLFNRLSAVRPLTDFDHALKAKLSSKDARLLYFAYGPEVVATCAFCTTEDPNSYLYYSLPAVLYPHLFHIAVLGLVTSSVISGREGSRWRTWATIAGIFLAAGELWITIGYDYKLNTRSTQLKDIDFFYWARRLYRGILFAAVDGLLGWAMYLSSTNRFFVSPPSTAERLEANTKNLEAALGRLWALGNIRNAVVRDKDLREAASQYWNEEKSIYEEREVVDGVNGALIRVDMEALTEEAAQQAEAVLTVWQHQNQPQSTNSQLP